MRQQFLEAATQDWILYIDSDETISDGLREEIRTITSKPVKKGDPLAYRVPIGIILNGTYIKYSSSYPGYQFRFFNRKSGAHFVKPVHERIEFDKKNIPIGTLKNPWYVYTTNDDWDRYLFHTAGYRTQEAHLYASRPWSFFWKSIVLRGLRTFSELSENQQRIILLHGFKNSIPVSGEIGRAVAPFCLMAETAHYKLFDTKRVVKSADTYD